MLTPKLLVLPLASMSYLIILIEGFTYSAEAGGYNWKLHAGCMVRARQQSVSELRVKSI